MDDLVAIVERHSRMLAELFDLLDDLANRIGLVELDVAILTRQLEDTR